MNTQVRKVETTEREKLLAALEFYIQYHIKPGDERLLSQVKELKHYFE